MVEETAGRKTGIGRRADRPLEIPRAGLWRVLKRVKAQLSDDHVTIIAGGVAFFTMLSLFPALAALVAIQGLLLTPSEVAGWIAEMSALLPPEVRSILSDHLTRLASAEPEALGLGTFIGLGAALWSASKGMKALLGGLDIAYGERDKRGFIKRTLMVLGLTLGGLVFLVVALGLVAAIPAMLEVLWLPGLLHWVLQLARWPVIIVLAMTAFAVLYHYGPDRERPKWRWVTPGALVASTIWVLASLAFSLYVSSFGSYAETYGALAGVVVLMMWLYLSAQAVLLGAEINAEMERQTRKDSTTGPPQPMGERGAHAADTLGH